MALLLEAESLEWLSLTEGDSCEEKEVFPLLHGVLHHSSSCSYSLTASKWPFTVNSYGAVKD